MINYSIPTNPSTTVATAVTAAAAAAADTAAMPVDRSVLLKRSHQQRSYNSNSDLSETRKRQHQPDEQEPETAVSSTMPASLGIAWGPEEAGLDYDGEVLDMLLLDPPPATLQQQQQLAGAVGMMGESTSTAVTQTLPADDMKVFAQQVQPISRQIDHFEALDDLNGDEADFAISDVLLQEGLELFQCQR